MTPQIWGVDIPFPEIAVPTMGIWGSTDFALSEEQMTDSVQYLTGPWRYERIEGAGHWIGLERPDELNALLLDFFRG
jgi:pimeloyl-ACP methyl ester carboxylesterase